MFLLIVAVHGGRIIAVQQCVFQCFCSSLLIITGIVCNVIAVVVAAVVADIIGIAIVLSGFVMLLNVTHIDCFRVCLCFPSNIS